LPRKAVIIKYPELMMKDSSSFKDGIGSDSSATGVVPRHDANETADGADLKRWAWPDDRGQCDWADHYSLNQHSITFFQSRLLTI